MHKETHSQILKQQHFFKKFLKILNFLKVPSSPSSRCFLPITSLASHSCTRFLFFLIYKYKYKYNWDTKYKLSTLLLSHLLPLLHKVCVLSHLQIQIQLGYKIQIIHIASHSGIYILCYSQIQIRIQKHLKSIILRKICVIKINCNCYSNSFKDKSEDGWIVTRAKTKVSISSISSDDGDDDEMVMIRWR